MQDILAEIAAVTESMENTQVVLLLHQCPCHVHQGVITKANSLNMWVVYVPARLTYLLQPLDVFAFSAYKSALMRQFRLRENAGDLCRGDWIRSVAELVSELRMGCAVGRLGICRMSLR